MNEDNCSGRKTRGTDLAEAEKKPPAGLGDQPIGWWKGLWARMRYHMVLGFQPLDLGARWHSLLTQQESGVGSSFGGRDEGAWEGPSLCKGGHVYLSAPYSELLRGLMNVPEGGGNSTDTITSALSPSTQQQNPKPFFTEVCKAHD